MRRWQSEIDKAIQQALENEPAQSLPGSGKPLDLRRNPYEPTDMALANKILKDNDLVPAWVTEGKEIDTARENLMREIERTANADGIKQRLRQRVEAFNKRVLDYNLTVPPGMQHKRMIRT